MRRNEKDIEKSDGDEQERFGADRDNNAKRRLIERFAPSPPNAVEGFAPSASRDHSSVGFERKYGKTSAIAIALALLSSVALCAVSLEGSFRSGSAVLLAACAALSALTAIAIVWIVAFAKRYPGHLIGTVPTSIIAMLPAALASCLSAQSALAAVLSAAALVVSSATLAFFAVASAEISSEADAVEYESNAGGDGACQGWSKRRIRRARRRIASRGGEAPETDERCAGGEGEPRTIVVLGYRIDDGNGNVKRFPKALERRIASSVEYASALRGGDDWSDGSPHDAFDEAFPFVLSGGIGGVRNGVRISESDAMAEILKRIDGSVSDYGIYREDKSQNTEDNVVYSMAVIEENSLPYPAVVFTSRYHVPRTARSAERATASGDIMFAEMMRFIGVKTPLFCAPFAWCEEVLATVYEWWRCGGDVHGVGGGNA